MQEHDTLYIGGEFVRSQSTDTIEVVNPSTEELVGRVPDPTTGDMDRAVAAARHAQDEGPWPLTSPAERAEVLTAISGLLKKRAEEIATTISSQNGSPITWGMGGQVYASAMVLDYYAQLAQEFPFEEVRTGARSTAVVRQEPVGVAAAIVPWNVPLFTAALKLGPALASGSTVVLKPAPETPLDAYHLAEVLDEAGLPPGVVNLVAAGREVGEHLVTHRGVDKVGFTGSSSAGRKIASLCGERLKRVTLELGGKSAAILMEDADLDEVLPALMRAAMMNNGQACVAQTRILAPAGRHDEVADAVTEHVRGLTVGNALDPDTDVGPLVAERQRERVEGYIEAGRTEGATLTIGGGRPEGQGKGWFVEPTVFANVDNAMKIAQEEIFGPVLSVIPYDGVDDAVSIANDSDYGLSGSVWGADPDAGLEVARRVRTGTYSVNTFGMEFSAPFGGYKQSGVGRELGPEGLKAYLESKSISAPHLNRD